MNVHSIIKSMLYVIFVFIGSAHSVTITVNGTDGSVANDGVCSISEAIIAANTDAVVSMSTGECIAGSGTDTINLSTDITLTAAFENDANYGNTGTPAITSPIILDGMGFSIVRDGACIIDTTNDLGEFRLMRTEVLGDLTLNNITLSNGCAVDGMGFAIYGAAILNEGVLSLEDSTFSGNSASEGGGVFSYGTIITIQKSTFSGNSADGGGGVFNLGTINTIQNSTFSGNSTDSGGGGIFNDGTITNIQNSTFSGNSANTGGGGILNFNTIITIQNSTFSGNPTDIGGGFLNIGIIGTLENSLFHQNTGGGTECFNGGDPINGSNNLSDDATSDCPAVSITLTTATVGSLADNGGQTMTHALLPNSEAIDAGGVGSTTTDQRGFAAIGTRDIGAFEFLGVDDGLIFSNGFETNIAIFN